MQELREKYCFTSTSFPNTTTAGGTQSTTSESLITAKTFGIGKQLAQTDSLDVERLKGWKFKQPTTNLQLGFDSVPTELNNCPDNASCTEVADDINQFGSGDDAEAQEPKKVISKFP